MRRFIFTNRTPAIVAMGVCCALALPAVRAENDGAIDMNRAKDLYQKKQNGGALTADEQAYLLRAIQQAGGKGGQGKPADHGGQEGQVEKKSDGGAAIAPGDVPPWRDYVNAKDGFEFKLESKTPTEKGGANYSISITPGVWHGETLKLSVTVYVPPKPIAPDLVLVLVGGCCPAVQMADDSGVCCAVVMSPWPACFGLQDPVAIAHHAVEQYYKTSDPLWMPNVAGERTLICVMDAITAVLKKDAGLSPQRFILSGHSKMGLASYATAIDDPRVQGIVPIGFDYINMTATSQQRSFVKVAMMQRVGIDESDTGKKCLSLFDPYTFRDRLTTSKLVISGASDSMFDLNSVNEYWDGLPGAKWHLYLDNADHGNESNNPKTLRALAAFTRLTALHKELPKLTWTFSETASSKLSVTGIISATVKAGRIWSASGDLKSAKWTDQPVTLTAKSGESAFAVEIEKPKAAYAEFDLELDGKPYSLTTGVFVGK